MTFCPEWLTGSPNLDTSNPLYLWVYLFVSAVVQCRCGQPFLLSAPVSFLRPTLVHERDVRTSILYPPLVCLWTVYSYSPPFTI